MTGTNESLNGLGKHEKASRRYSAKSLDSDVIEIDEITGQIRAVAERAEKKLKRFSNAAVDFTKENPFYVAMGVLALTAAGAFLVMRKSRRES